LRRGAPAPLFLCCKAAGGNSRKLITGRIPLKMSENGNSFPQFSPDFEPMQPLKTQTHLFHRNMKSLPLDFQAFILIHGIFFSS
jgi:hypothetical protein